MSPSPPSTEDSAPAAKRSSVAWIRSGAACPPSLPRISRPSLSTRERGNDHGQDLPALRCEGDRRLLDERDYGARRWPSVSHASPVLLLRRLYAEKAQRPSGTIHGRKVRRSGPRALSGRAPNEDRAANGPTSSARARETPTLAGHDALRLVAHVHVRDAGFLVEFEMRLELDLALVVHENPLDGPANFHLA